MEPRGREGEGRGSRRGGKGKEAEEGGGKGGGEKWGRGEKQRGGRRVVGRGEPRGRLRRERKAGERWAAPARHLLPPPPAKVPGRRIPAPPARLPPLGQPPRKHPGNPYGAPKGLASLLGWALQQPQNQTTQGWQLCSQLSPASSPPGHTGCAARREAKVLPRASACPRFSRPQPTSKVSGAAPPTLQMRKLRHGAVK